MSPRKALGVNYFSRSGYPVMVVQVHSDSEDEASHPHDLTEVEHDHDFCELVIVTAGKAMQRLEGFDYQVRTGDVYLLQSRHRHYFYDRQGLELINVMYDPARLPLPTTELRRLPGYSALFLLEPRFRQQHNFASRLRLGPLTLAGAEQIALNMLGEVEDRKPGTEAALFARLLELIIYVSRQYGADPTTKGRALLRVGEVISTLEQEYDRAWTVDELAHIAGMSRSNFLRIFRQATGRTPVDYLIRVRLQAAIRLLCHSDQTVSEIAFDVGFSDSNYFARQFRKGLGMSPTEYRRRNA